jgi:glycosyltransferase involved in cell wall biosynthesis
MFAQLRLTALEGLAQQVDLFWVIDYPSLPTVMGVAERTGVPVLYETVDLVPEYQYRSKADLRGERRLIGRVDGFVTACDSYADYYVERYGGDVLPRRPVVRDNMPEQIMSAIRPSGSPLRLLFLGSLMFDRPVMELIESMASVVPGVTLTLQGKNYLRSGPRERVKALRLQDRVKIIDPCPPDRTVEEAAEYDVGVVALKGENENERRASTSKLFTYMAAGLAVLGSDLPGIARLVGHHSNGALVRGCRPSDWTAAINAVVSMSLAEVDLMKQRSLDAARRYAWDIQRHAFLAEFERALGRSAMRRTR